MSTTQTNIEAIIQAKLARAKVAEDAAIARWDNAGEETGRIVRGSCVQASLSGDPQLAAKYKDKFLVTIKTIGLDGKFDGGLRIVATSDLHTVQHMPEVAKLAKKNGKEAKRQVDAELQAAIKAAGGLDALKAKLGIAKVAAKPQLAEIEAE